VTSWRSLAVLTASLLCAASLAGCAPGPHAPADTGVCYHMVVNGPGQSGGVVSDKYRFFVLQRDVADLEHCAAALDRMRIRFLALGGSNHEVSGVYQGEYLFVDPRGVFSSSSLQAETFPLLRRTDDGRLVPPSAPDQPPQ
jgi:hypothetical protein